jgi:hypothetical protein
MGGEEVNLTELVYKGDESRGCKMIQEGCTNIIFLEIRILYNVVINPHGKTIPSRFTRFSSPSALLPALMQGTFSGRIPLPHEFSAYDPPVLSYP